MRLETQFNIGDVVNVDGHIDLCAVITAFIFRGKESLDIELSWICGGDAKCRNIEHWRVTKANA